MNLTNELRVKPGKKVNLKHYDPEETFGCKKNDKMQAKLEKDLAQLDQLQYMLYAENKHALLVVLQAVDTAGKDGTIRHVMTGMSPQSCKVASFKTPTPEEAAHDYLWRVHKVVPERGEVGIFNRSHYEDVLVVRVHDLVPKSVWSKRYDQINHFEQLLNANGVTIVKLFLHISKKEQKRTARTAPGRSGQALETFAFGFQGTAILGRLSESLRGGHHSLQYRGCAMVHHPFESQMVPQFRRQPDSGGDTGAVEHEISQGHGGYFTGEIEIKSGAVAFKARSRTVLAWLESR